MKKKENVPNVMNTNTHYAHSINKMFYFGIILIIYLHNIFYLIEWDLYLMLSMLRQIVAELWADSKRYTTHNMLLTHHMRESDVYEINLTVHSLIPAFVSRFAQLNINIQQTELKQIAIPKRQQSKCNHIKIRLWCL